MFLNRSKGLDKLIIGLSNLGFLSECINKDFNLSIYFCFKLGSSNLLIKSIRADSSWVCLVRTVICLIGLQQTSLHPYVILLSLESVLGEWLSEEVSGLSEEELLTDWFNWKISNIWTLDSSLICNWLTLSFNFCFSLHLLE